MLAYFASLMTDRLPSEKAISAEQTYIGEKPGVGIIIIQGKKASVTGWQDSNTLILALS